MPYLEFDDIKEGDIVLVEAFIKKYFPKKGGKTGLYQASFDLVDICLLYSATDEEHAAYVAGKMAKRSSHVGTSDDVVL